MTGTCSESSSHLASGRSMPARPAMAVRWMMALVDPPSGEEGQRGVLERLFGENLGRPHVASDEVDGHGSGAFGEDATSRVGTRYRRAAG